MHREVRCINSLHKKKIRCSKKECFDYDKKNWDVKNIYRKPISTTHSFIRNTLKIQNKIHKYFLIIFFNIHTVTKK